MESRYRLCIFNGNPALFKQKRMPTLHKTTASLRTYQPIGLHLAKKQSLISDDASVPEEGTTMIVMARNQENVRPSELMARNFAGLRLRGLQWPRPRLAPRIPQRLSHSRLVKRPEQR
ncbi:MAG: hypothetical protein U0894_10375 [Pirellulales bacterium]